MKTQILYSLYYNDKEIYINRVDVQSSDSQFDNKIMSFEISLDQLILSYITTHNLNGRMSLIKMVGEYDLEKGVYKIINGKVINYRREEKYHE